MDTNSDTTKVLEGTLVTEPYYPTHFFRGTQIAINDNGNDATSVLKSVELLCSADFLRAQYVRDDLWMEANFFVCEIRADVNSAAFVTVIFEQRGNAGANIIEQVRYDCAVEFPFFVVSRESWASCNPRKTANLYGLDCDALTIGDNCILLIQKEDDQN